MICKHCGGDNIYYYCVTCQKSGKKEKGFFKTVVLKKARTPTDNSRFCMYCGSSVGLNDLECSLCGHQFPQL